MARKASAQIRRGSDVFVPGIDDGLWLAEPSSLAPERTAPLALDFLSLASQARERLDTYRSMWRQQIWTKSAVFPTALAVARNVRFEASKMMIEDKFLINSAAGTRLRVYLNQKNKPLSDEISSYLTHTSFENNESIPIYPGDWRDLDLVIESRNFFNFYHFLKETLPNLVLYEENKLRGKVVIFGGGRDVSDFVPDLCKTWFSEIADRIEFVPGPSTRAYEHALVPLNTMHLYFQSRSRLITSIDDVGAEVKRRATLDNFIPLSRNSCEKPLMKLREVVRRQVPDGSSQRRRLYVARKSRRLRRVVGEDILIESLARLNFETVCFEDFSVKEQAKLVGEAEAIVSIHGAGMTNMLFAPEGCHVIELSNRQTLKSRYGDFNPLAIAAGIKYSHIFLDHDFEDSTSVPTIAKHGHRGVVVDKFRADVIASWMAAKLFPDDAERAGSICHALNESRDFRELALQLERYKDQLFHLADYHVWMANSLNFKGQERDSLSSLLNALVLGPRRTFLHKRILNLAYKLGDTHAFAEAEEHLRRFGGEEFEGFFAERGWPVQAEG